ncbi:hypothetical protein [Methylomonas rivi]|uniref:DUF2591 domain-containing protein n=1 Tax=Methylomonas rivi TaxID=2952226 RepID=A0ABT1U575_9GAMM|nr:hypothetical protein [Methylomonas sp. WSC-6]MCQ8129000.1 hypothetical protein [Methylomonas sp. WSC-6]
MAYALHIERSPQGLTLDEWIEEVTKQDGVKLVEIGVEAKNPTTGETISIEGRPGDVAVLFPTTGFLGFGRKAEWRTCIRFVRNKASFNATPELESPHNPLRVAASSLAAALGAKIVGDEGEVYEW